MVRVRTPGGHTSGTPSTRMGADWLWLLGTVALRTRTALPRQRSFAPRAADCSSPLYHQVQNPTTSLADDVAVTKRVLAEQKAPVILVGHSYGGVVITEAGNDPGVAGLIYIAAFAPDRGESVGTLVKDPSPGAPVPPILPPQQGFLELDRSMFAASFAADVAPEKAEFMANSQVPWGLDALNGAVTQPAWKSKPSWHLVRPTIA